MTTINNKTRTHYTLTVIHSIDMSDRLFKTLFNLNTQTSLHIYYCVTYPSVLIKPRTPVSDSPISDTLSPIFKNDDGLRQNPPSSISMSSCMEMALRIEALLLTPDLFFEDMLSTFTKIVSNFRYFHWDFDSLFILGKMLSTDHPNIFAITDHIISLLLIHGKN